MTKAHNTQILEMDHVTLIMMLIHLSCPQNDLSADPQQYFLNTATNSRSDLSILLLITIHFPPIELTVASRISSTIHPQGPPPPVQSFLRSVSPSVLELQMNGFSLLFIQLLR